MIPVPVNPEVVRWAMKRASVSADHLVKKFERLERLGDWQAGISMPNLVQAELLAEKLRIPLPVLLLDEAPDLELPIADLRTVSEETQHPSLEFFETLTDAVVRQNWYREQLIFQKAKRLPFVGRFNIHNSENEIARSVSATLLLDDNLRAQCSSWKEFLGRLVDNAEDAGVLVMRNSVLRNDNSRKLDVREFRGFAISDPYAPLVFINSRDAKAAQIFTLVHELAHIWVGSTGISNPNPTKKREDFGGAVERLCNDVAAEVLVPEAKFSKMWLASRDTDANVNQLGRYFRVSSLVVLRRAYELQKLNSDEFFEKVKKAYERFREMERAAKEDKEESSGNFWNLFTMRNSQRFTDAVALAARSEHVSFVYGAGLLGVKAKTLEAYLKKFHS
jgi:Zn-dependent peptidase ImmA (M78 family)